MKESELGDRAKKFADIIEGQRRSTQSRWTEELVREGVENPQQLKMAAEVCQECPKPCKESEICSTVLAKKANLFDKTDKEQAFWLVEAGIERLKIKDVVRKREEGEIRPNMFVKKCDQ